MDFIIIIIYDYKMFNLQSFNIQLQVIVVIMINVLDHISWFDNLPIGLFS